MKAIKSLLTCAISATAIALSASHAKASDLCDINARNYSQFTSVYNPFDHNQNTPLRSFINPQYYSIGDGAIAAPIYYTAIDGGNAVVVAFDIKGNLGGKSISQNDSVIQYLASPQGSPYYPNKPQTLSIYKLPQGAQLAIQEAKYGITQETIGNMFR